MLKELAQGDVTGFGVRSGYFLLYARVRPEVRKKQSVWLATERKGFVGGRDDCWPCFGSQVLVHQQLLCMSGFSSPRPRAKGLFLPHIKRLWNLASALRFLLPGLVKRLRSAQTREINLLHLLSKIKDSRLLRKRKSFCFVAYLCVRPDSHPLHRCKSQCGK